MNSFEYTSPVYVHFGEGERKKIGAYLRDRYTDVLLVTAEGPFRENGLFAEIRDCLLNHGIAVREMSDIESNPKLKSAREGREICRKKGIDCIVALGGGSVIDCAKVIAASAEMDVDPFDLIWGERIPVSGALPVVAVPTIAATSTEMNNYAMMVNEETKEKFYCQGMFSEMAILDPETTLTGPENLTLWGIMDILSHIYEFYFNGCEAAPTQTFLSECLIRSTMLAAERLHRDMSDVAARGELLWCAALSWGGLTKIGRGDPDMTCHGIEESFSGYFDTHHGACLGVLTPRWMERTIPHVPAPFARFARQIFGVTLESELDAAREGLKRYKKWLSSIGAPNTYSDFSDIDFTEEGFTVVAEHAISIYGGKVGSIYPLTSEAEIVKFLKMGLEPY
jgi:alcohol dehydrogenase YqhD (iron-dependent ADH family)